MKAQVGVFQELQSNGQVAQSWMRIVCTGIILGAFGYLLNQLLLEHHQLDYLWKLLVDKTIDLHTYEIMKMDIAKVDWVVFNGTLGTGIAGKVVQKFGEAQPPTIPAP